MQPDPPPEDSRFESFLSYVTAALWSWDFGVAGALGIGACVLGLREEVAAKATAVLLTEAGIGVALTSTVLASLAVFATFFDGAYRTALEYAGGFRRALEPYVLVAAVSATTSIVGVVGALAIPACGRTLTGLLIGAATFFCVWALAGAVSLTGITIFHASSRAKLMGGVDRARSIRAERLRQQQPTGPS